MTQLCNATPEELIDALLRSTIPSYDPESEHMRDTPRRFVGMLRELTDASENFKFTTFETNSRELVIIKDIRFVSLCAHHIAPFTGVAHIGYIPNDVIAGLSKFSRHVKAMAHSLTNQEELTTNIADSLDDILDPTGVAVIMEASHSCMSIRGALAHGTTTITSAMRGAFADHQKTAKVEFMTLIGRT